jgi:Na+/H+ antiporter NhaC
VIDGLRKAYSAVGVLLMLAYVLQLYLIAAAIFTVTHANDNARDVYAAFKQADTGYLAAHRANGDLTALLILVLIGLAFGARMPGRTKSLTALLFALIVFQSLIPSSPVPAAVSALHGVNALVLVGLTGYLTARNWAFGRRSPLLPGQPVSPP